MWGITAALSVLVLSIITFSIYKSGVPSTINGVKVVVVGGGVAGLTAASKLHNEGFKVVLLEAQDHIGGRTFTRKLLNGQYFEEGAEWILGEEGNSIFQLVQPLGLVNPPTADDSWDFDYALENGEHLNKSVCTELEKIFGYMTTDPERWAASLKGNVSLGDFARFILEKYNKVHPFTNNENFLNAVYDWGHKCSTAWDGSDNWFEKSNSDKGEQYVALEGSEQITWKTPYSYSSLHQLLITGSVTESGNFSLPKLIKLNSVVENIQYSTNSETVKVILEDGSEYLANHVVFTPSLGVLKTKHKELFTPQLSAKKQLTIENIGFGSATKLTYEFDSPW